MLQIVDWGVIDELSRFLPHEKVNRITFWDLMLPLGVNCLWHSLVAINKTSLGRLTETSKSDYEYIVSGVNIIKLVKL